MLLYRNSSKRSTKYSCVCVQIRTSARPKQRRLYERSGRRHPPRRRSFPHPATASEQLRRRRRRQYSVVSQFPSGKFQYTSFRIHNRASVTVRTYNNKVPPATRPFLNLLQLLLRQLLLQFQLVSYQRTHLQLTLLLLISLQLLPQHQRQLPVMPI